MGKLGSEIQIRGWPRYMGMAMGLLKNDVIWTLPPGATFSIAPWQVCHPVVPSDHWTPFSSCMVWLLWPFDTQPHSASLQELTSAPWNSLPLAWVLCTIRASPISSDSFFFLLSSSVVCCPPTAQFSPLLAFPSTFSPFFISLQFYQLLLCGYFPAMSARLKSPSPAGHIIQVYTPYILGWSLGLQDMFILQCSLPIRALSSFHHLSSESHCHLKFLLFHFQLLRFIHQQIFRVHPLCAGSWGLSSEHNWGGLCFHGAYILSAA